MRVTVLVEQVDLHKYRASTSQPVTMESEGSTSDEAIERLCELARQRLTSGELRVVAIPEIPEPNPWVRYAGVWKDHPDFDAFLENIAEYRRDVDQAAGTP